MDQAVDIPRDTENIVTVVSRPSKEVGPSTPHEMVVGISYVYTAQQQDPDHVQWPLSQEENGPHLSKKKCMAPLSS